jgi:hypothetical protein
MRVLDSSRRDLDRDGIAETVVITYSKRKDGHPLGGEIVVLRPAGDGTLRTIWRQKKMNPWKLRLADVDGDRKSEIVVGVWKKSPRDPVMAKRTFIYGWNGKRMLPKWLGSRLSRRFDDFDLADVNGDGYSELMALEAAPGQNHRISVYRWKSFGLEWLGCTNDLPSLTALKSVDGRAVAISGSRQLRINHSHGNVILTEQRSITR